jgi:hypothetical protein
MSSRFGETGTREQAELIGDLQRCQRIAHDLQESLVPAVLEGHVIGDNDLDLHPRLDRLDDRPKRVEVEADGHATN